MMHIRSNRQDSEATVVKVNRKHQIALNVEVRRLEMEKKMRERYLCFEMSLIHARRFKIIERQKSLGIYRPHAKEIMEKSAGKDSKAKHFFFTQAVAMDAKFKLPPLSQETQGKFGTKIDGSSKILNLQENFIFNKITTGKGHRKHASKTIKEGTFPINDHSFLKPRERKTFKTIKEPCTQYKGNLSIEISTMAKEDKNLLDETEKEATLPDTDAKNEKLVNNEQGASCPCDNNPIQNDSKELREISKTETALNIFPSCDRKEVSSAREQNISNVRRMNSWHNTTENYFVDENGATTSKSTRGQGRTEVRPHSAFEMLTAID